MPDPAMTLSVVTALHPARTQFIGDTAHSVELLANALGAMGWSLEWAVATDGPGHFDTETAAALRTASELVSLPAPSGPAACRNLALAHTSGHWVLSLDGDDLAEPLGIRQLCATSSDNVGLIAGNRLVFENGSRVLKASMHFSTTPWQWAPGQLAPQWSSPFCFHPNAAVVARRALEEIGGWPDLDVNEDLAMVLFVSEVASVGFLPVPVVRARLWPGQITAATDFLERKQRSWPWIEERLNQLRATRAREPVVAPPVAGPFQGSRTVPAGTFA